MPGALLLQSLNGFPRDVKVVFVSVDRSLQKPTSYVLNQVNCGTRSISEASSIETPSPVFISRAFCPLAPIRVVSLDCEGPGLGCPVGASTGPAVIWGSGFTAVDALVRSNLDHASADASAGRVG